MINHYIKMLQCYKQNTIICVIFQFMNNTNNKKRKVRGKPGRTPNPTRTPSADKFNAICSNIRIISEENRNRRFHCSEDSMVYIMAAFAKFIKPILSDVQKTASKIEEFMSVGFDQSLTEFTKSHLISKELQKEKVLNYHSQSSQKTVCGPPKQQLIPTCMEEVIEDMTHVVSAFVSTHQMHYPQLEYADFLKNYLPCLTSGGTSTLHKKTAEILSTCEINVQADSENISKKNITSEKLDEALAFLRKFFQLQSRTNQYPVKIQCLDETGFQTIEQFTSFCKRMSPSRHVLGLEKYQNAKAGEKYSVFVGLLLTVVDNQVVDAVIPEFTIDIFKTSEEGNVTSESYREYFDTIMEFLDANTWIFLDKASFHTFAHPSMGSAMRMRKEELEKWWTSYEHTRDLKGYDKVSDKRQYIKDHLLETYVEHVSSKKGVKVQFTPTGFPDYNPIELVFHILKQEVRQNTTSNRGVDTSIKKLEQQLPLYDGTLEERTQKLVNSANKSYKLMQEDMEATKFVVSVANEQTKKKEEYIASNTEHPFCYKITILRQTYFEVNPKHIYADQVKKYQVELAKRKKVTLKTSFDGIFQLEQDEIMHQAENNAKRVPSLQNRVTEFDQFVDIW